MSDVPANSTRNAVLSLLEHIQARPTMYLLYQDGSRLAALETYLVGFDTACRVNGVAELDVGRSFSAWLKEHKRLKRGGASTCWSALIEMNSKNEEDAWEACFSYLREYLEDRDKV